MKAATKSAYLQGAQGDRTLTGWIAVPVGIVLMIYVWFISAGLWSTWPKTAVYDYYSNLAAAFQHGQLHLEDQPSPELLALPDPYRISARRNLDYIWDATLYEGRYYLYWGPVPALILVPFRLLLGNQHIPDLYLAFVFIVGLFLVLCWLLRRIWRRFFSDLSPWTLSLAILVTGLAPPLTWMLNRPEVYEAALSGAQLFLLIALCLCFSVLDAAPHPTIRMALASLSLGLAIGCRSSEIFPAAFIGLLLTLFVFRTWPGRARQASAWEPLLAIWLPVSAVIMVLLAYNAARFGSALEFGYRYQLTLLQMPKHYDELFSASYLLPNLYNYFVNPFTLAADFPPIRPQYGILNLGPGISIPGIYFSEAVTGLFLTFPFMIFAFGLLRLPRSHSGNLEEAREHRSAPSWPWLRVLLLGVLALELAALLLFFFATERYLVEVVPALALVACIGFWQLLTANEPATGRGRVKAAVAILLASASIACSTLLAISSYQERMRMFNPELMELINRWLKG